MVDIHRPRFDERKEAKLHRSGIAAGVRHEPCMRYRMPVDFGKTVDRFPHELGGGVLRLVPPLPFGDVLDAEVGGKVDDARAVSSTVRASPIATPFGVAKNTMSHPASARGVGSVNVISTRRRKLGNMRATGVPASLRDVIAFSSTWGCWARSRRSSTPVYPVPPTMPALIIKMKKPPGGGFRFAELLYSAFRVLLAPPCLV